MRYIDFAYQDYKYMELAPNEEMFYDRKLSLGAECCEKLLKQLVQDGSNKEPNKTHSQKVLLNILVSDYGFSELKTFRGLAAELTEIYFVRRYPGDGYYNLDSEEFEDLYNNTLKFIEELVKCFNYETPFDNDFGNRKDNTKTIRMEL